MDDDWPNGWTWQRPDAGYFRLSDISALVPPLGGLRASLCSGCYARGHCVPRTPSKPPPHVAPRDTSQTRHSPFLGASLSKRVLV